MLAGPSASRLGCDIPGRKLSTRFGSYHATSLQQGFGSFVPQFPHTGNENRFFSEGVGNRCQIVLIKYFEDKCFVAAKFYYTREAQL